MKYLEDIVRDRVVKSALEDIEPGASMDRQDIELFGNMVYALLRAGARREGQKGFQEVFQHFAGPGSRYTPDQLEYIRQGLIHSVEKHAREAQALRLYFQSLETNGETSEAKQAATTEAMTILDD